MLEEQDIQKAFNNYSEIDSPLFIVKNTPTISYFNSMKISANQKSTKSLVNKQVLHQMLGSPSNIPKK
jgi:hypothetical protein